MNLKTDIKVHFQKSSGNKDFFLDTVPPKGKVKTLVNSLNYFLKITSLETSIKGSQLYPK